MEVTEKIQAPSTLTPRNVPDIHWTWNSMRPRADMDTSLKGKISYPYFKVAHPHCITKYKWILQSLMTDAIFISYPHWSNHYTQTNNFTPNSMCLASTLVSYRHRAPAEVNFLTISMLLFTPHTHTHTHTQSWVLLLNICYQTPLQGPN
jgi:hypothetical protein